jgi:prepilin-type N-terminal cleavage/methylation domain-containing protein/prepilin-type processing-associated H-X9-DG protein
MHQPNPAFTLMELLVVIAVITILSAVSLSAVASAKSRAQRVTCSNNLKQVGLSFRTWAIAHNGNMPQTLAASQGGDADDVGYRTLTTSQKVYNANGGYVTGSRGVSMIFLVMSNELSTPKILFCPAEYESAYRQAASTFAGVQPPTSTNSLYTNDLNVSYFIGVDAQETYPRMFLTGDHNLGGNANPPTSPFCAAPSVYNPSFAVWLGTNWTVNMGPAFLNNQHSLQGNVGLADGSVEWFNRSELQNALKNTGDMGRSTSFTMGPGTTAGVGCNRLQFP